MSTSDTPLISCLCITEDRQDFMPWLLWNYDRQSWANRELVVVDSSRRPFDFGQRDDIRVVREPHRSGVGQKRNLALEHARGEIITWFDDDDWQHPEKLSLLAKALQDGKPFAGCTDSWFLNLAKMRCSPYRAAGRRLLFNGVGVKTDAARAVRFPTHVKKASDTRWMQDLERKFRSRGAVVKTPLFFWLCHGTNLSNPANRRRFDRDIAQIESSLGQSGWSDTTAALQSLSERLDGNIINKTIINTMTSKTNLNKRVKSVSRDSDSTEAPKATVPVTAMVKATVLDAGYLGTMLPHMLKQAKYRFKERIVVVDPRREFEGKYRTRHASSRQELDRVLADLVDKGEIDRILEVPYDGATVASTNRAYFRRSDVPTHAISGGPIYPTIWGLEQATTDYILQFDADIFFYSDGDSWVSRALQCMQADPSLWIMMTHAGPPVGPAGRSLAGANRRRAHWDAKHQVWRFRTASTRFFLTDRRMLRGRLRVFGSGGSCRPLEQCISKTLTANNAYRGDIGNCKTWHLHAHSHADPFTEWAPHLVEAVESGRFPAFQAGIYDLSLDKQSDRAQWKRLLFPENGSRARASVTVSKEQRVRAGQSASIVSKAEGKAPIQVIIPVRDRTPDRLRATLASLKWQQRPPAQTLIVSHGSSAHIDSGLEKLCRDNDCRFERIASPETPWCKPQALNHGIRLAPSHLPYIMTLDADMILAPNFLAVVIKELEQAADPGAMVLCRSGDLPRTAQIHSSSRALLQSFERLRRSSRLRGRQGCGGIQAASRSFFHDVRGYDEAYTWWGEEDRDMVERADNYGLDLVWIEQHTSMLHQWHPHATKNSDSRHRQVVSQALVSNQARRKARRGLIVCDNSGW